MDKIWDRNPSKLQLAVLQVNKFRICVVLLWYECLLLK